MRIALAQLNAVVGDLEGNVARMRDALRRAKAAGASLAVFPELSVTGYPPRDLLLKGDFVRAQRRALAALARDTRGIACVAGFADPNPGEGRPLFNAAALLHGGRIAAVAHKSLLPFYDVFDEERYFERGAPDGVVRFGGTRLGLSICEDAWNDKAYWKTRHYAVDPMAELARRGARILVNISASPWWRGKGALRQDMLASIARRRKTPLIFVNQVGGNDDLVFDGRSCAFDARGRLMARAAAFAEDLVVVDLEAGAGTVRPEPAGDTAETWDALVLGVRDYVRKCGFSDVVLGLSGGIDSSLVAAIAVEALGPSRVHGALLPSRFTSRASGEDARTMAHALGIRVREIPIEGVFAASLRALSPAFAGRKADVTEENLQARIRGLILMGLSNKFGWMLLTTGNKSELATGYCTLYGDMCGGLAVISDLPKMQVYALSRHANTVRAAIPERVFTRPPTAELRRNQTDQDSLPPYDLLDGILERYIVHDEDPAAIVRRGFDPATVAAVVGMVDRNEYKRRQMPPGLKVTPRAFGAGRRLPIAQGYRPAARAAARRP
ncbi:MAG: NAD+ synthase [Candidatus Brocadiae bacterium]|nr:NAD+ synthase [Candidatus Brocadiia bacterium]